jgi:hypothetical protein
VVAGAQPLAQTQSYGSGGQTLVYGAANPGSSTSLYGNAGANNTLVTGAQPANANGANEAALDLNPLVPSRTAQAQVNWPPAVQATPEEQAAALLVHEAAGGPPAPPGLTVEEPASGPPAIPSTRGR